MQTSSKTILLTFCLCFITQVDVWSQACVVPPPPNLTPEGGFEAYNVPSGSTINASFNNGYIPGWFSGNGTPSLCNSITHINGSQTINAFEGTDFACLSCSRDGSTCSENEMIFTNVYLCQGAKYRLNFAFHRIYVTGLGPGVNTGTHSIRAVIDATAEINANESGSPCFFSEGDVQSVANVVVNNSNSVGWQSVSVDFVFNGATGTYPLKLFPIIGNAVNTFNIGLDAVNLTCIESPIRPSIGSRNYCGNSFSFIGSISGASGGSGVATWCWDFGDGNTASGQNVQHVYSQPGTYQVCLTITDNCGGCSQQVCRTVSTDCSEYSCPCTTTNSLNIDATLTSPYYDPVLGGVLYSVLEQAENFDQNNDSEIYGAEHGGCIAIAGRLIIDQNINFNSANIKMQPCAEIVVQRVGSGALPTLRLETNQINGCEQMWRGITVEDGARLELLENGIADAEFAVTAKASFASATNLTSVTIQDNVFRRNHVGVKFEGIPNQPSSINHVPFVNNTFLGFQAGASLLPPCSPKLENYFSQYGYAGVVALNTSLFLGTTLPKGEVSNDFNGLRNGVISKQARLDVRSNRFQNINQEYWGTINSNEFHQGGSASPTYEYSSGIAIAVERGTASIEGNQFDTCGHGVFSSFAASTAVRNNDFNPVGIAVEAFAPYDLLVRDNTNMVFARRAVVARELNASSRYLIEGNTGVTGNIPGLTDNPFWRFPAVQASNVGGLLLDDARISGNQFTISKNASYGFHLEGNGGWIIDENIVQGGLTLEGIKLLQSDFNFLYNNTVERPLLQNNQGTAFSVSNGVNNRFCCNTANKVHKAFHFELYSDNTALFSNNMLEQNQSIFCPAGTIIGEQLDRGNDFGFIAETATHLGPSIEVQNSQFRVQQLSKPFAPQNVVTPQVGSLLWFTDLGMHPSCDATCIPPDELPDLQGEDTDDTDRALVNGDFHSDSPVLEWEGMRQLYSKLERKPDLRDDDAKVAAFYSSAQNGKLGAYYEAQRALYEQRQIGASHKAALAPLNAVLDSLNTQLNAAMIALQSAHGQDSLSILEAIRQNVTAQDMYAFHLAQLQNTIEQQRSQQTQTAIQLNNALPADAIYESNRKTVNEIYLQTLAQNIVTLTPAQLAQVSAIAHQCVFEGGAAVLDARLLYQLHEIKSFDEDTLCAGSRQQRVTAVQNAGQPLSLQPNPANNLVLIKGIPEKDPGEIRIQLNSAHGQSRTIRPTQAFFSVADLPAGVYYCTIWNGDLFLGTQRLLVIH